MRAGSRTGLQVQFGWGIGASWWLAPAFKHNLAGGLVRAGGPRRLLSTIWPIGVGWWPAPAVKYNLAGDWCGLVARTGFLVQFGWGDFLRAGGPHRLLSTIWRGLVRAGGPHRL